MLLDCCLSGEKSVITNEQTQSMQIREGGKVSSEHNTSGRERGRRRETAAEQRWKTCALWTQTPCGVYIKQECDPADPLDLLLQGKKITFWLVYCVPGSRNTQSSLTYSVNSNLDAWNSSCVWRSQISIQAKLKQQIKMWNAQHFQFTNLEPDAFV